MKRFLTAALLLLAIALGGYYAVFYGGAYLPMGGDAALSVPFRAEGKQLQRWDGQAYVPLTLRGVDVSASLPGHYATSYAAEKEDYLRWFQAIGEMGANAVRVTSIMDDDFYDALYDYNSSHDTPLYLLQSIGVTDQAGNGTEDAYSEDFLGALLADGKTVVDVIHGRRNRSADGLQGDGIYRRDISPWVVGFQVGTEWYPDTIVYTDHSPIRSGAYQGNYFQTTADATPFEAAMAQVMDTLTAYETHKYNTQRPVGFLCDPSCDFLEYAEVYARQLQKYAQVDPELVTPLPAMKAGCFAAYRLFDFCDSFTSVLSEAQKENLTSLLEDLPTEAPYGGYLTLLSRYHTMPVLATGYGFSSSRGAVVQDRPPLNEQEQGEHLAKVSQALEDSGWAGGFISTWQDHWERRSWNTAFATIPTKNDMWHDLLSDGQGYGLMAFTPGAEPSCVLNGTPDEWAPEDRLLERDGLRLSARYDAEALYLLLEGVREDTPVYLPLDISPEMGSSTSDEPKLHFPRDVDFLLCLNGRDDSRLLVQERCDPMRERFLYEVEGKDPFLSFPKKESGTFVPLRMAVRNPLLVDVLTPETRALQRLGTWEAGKLTHGNGDSAAAEYNSLADFCFGGDCVEIRLPWLLLNIGDPSNGMVHRDYYAQYGVSFQPVRELWIGATQAGAEEVPMVSLRLAGWKKLDHQERLKQSYDIMQRCWKGEAKDGTSVR